MSEKKRDKGRFTERPEGAAELFNPESGRKAALKRWEDKEARNREALIGFVSAQMDQAVTYEQALDFVVLSPQFREALGGKTAAAKIILQLMGEMPDGADVKVLVDQRQVNFMNFNFTTHQARLYIEDQRRQGNETIAALVENQVNWDATEGEIITVKVPIDDEN